MILSQYAQLIIPHAWTLVPTKPPHMNVLHMWQLIIPGTIRNGTVHSIRNQLLARIEIVTRIDRSCRTHVEQKLVWTVWVCQHEAAHATREPLDGTTAWTTVRSVASLSAQVVHLVFVFWYIIIIINHHMGNINNYHDTPGNNQANHHADRSRRSVSNCLLANTNARDCCRSTCLPHLINWSHRFDRRWCILSRVMRATTNNKLTRIISMRVWTA